MPKRKKKLSLIVSVHYVKLVYRAALFLLAAVIYVLGWNNDPRHLVEWLEQRHWILAVIGAVYTVEMLTRFFPSRLESPGCQKQFRKNYIPTGETAPERMPWTRTLAVAAAWIGLNGIIGALRKCNIIDDGILILISLAYGVCDIICILFFCPFQTWFMKNRCCTVCRIYNWDFAMMFTPYLFISQNHWFKWSMLAMALALLVRWELTYRFHPERFSEKTNACLDCAHCEEKLCHHKKQLRSFWKKNKARFSFRSSESSARNN